MPTPGLEGLLKGIAPEAFFLDFSSVTDQKTRAVLDSETTARVEGNAKHVVPSREFDGALFVHDVTPPELPK